MLGIGWFNIALVRAQLIAFIAESRNVFCINNFSGLSEISYLAAFRAIPGFILVTDCDVLQAERFGNFPQINGEIFKPAAFAVMQKSQPRNKLDFQIWLVLYSRRHAGPLESSCPQRYCGAHFLPSPFIPLVLRKLYAEYNSTRLRVVVSCCACSSKLVY